MDRGGESSMNCKAFKKCIWDYLTNELSYNKGEEMREHLDHCSQCNTLCEKENAREELLKEYFFNTPVSFQRLRTHVMERIDKDRYNSSLRNKLKFHFKRHGVFYNTTAASLILLLAFVLAINNYVNMKDILNSQGRIGLRNMISMEDTKNGNIAAKKSSIIDSPIKFARTSIKPETDLTSASPVEASLDERLSAHIIGKKDSGKLTNSGKIFVQDSLDNSSWTLEILQNPDYTVRDFEWIAEDVMLVVVAPSKASDYRGGEIYAVQAYKGLSWFFYSSGNVLEEVTEIKRLDEEHYDISFNIFDDNSKSKYRSTIRAARLDKNGSAVK